jgi:ribose 5-phosphate isomerase B
MSIAANRDKNIRAGLAFKSEIAKLMREHNDANVLVLPGRFINIQDALKCIKNFLTTDFEGKRHQDRVNKLS